MSSYLQDYFSFKKFSIFLSILILPIILLLASTSLTIIFILKPHQPSFSLQTIKLQSYQFKVSGSNLLITSAALNLTLNAANPNKFGVGFSPTTLRVLYHGVIVGIVGVPGFYQPPHSEGLGVETHALFGCVNVSEILSDGVLSRGRRRNLSSESYYDPFPTSILGDVVAEVRILRVRLPKVKFALECNISIDSSYFMLSIKALYKAQAAKNHTKQVRSTLLGYNLFGYIVG